MSAQDADALAEHIHAIDRLLRQAVLTEARRLPEPLTPPQARAMEALVEADRRGSALSLSQLSEQMGLAHSTVSGIVARLERRGLVHRTTWTRDRRHVRIEPSTEVRDWVSGDLPRLRRRPLEDALADMSAGQAAALRDGLARLRRLLEADT